MTELDLTRTFSLEQYRSGLSSWRWLDFRAREPLFSSPFGDVFFRAPDGFWWLDTLEATLTRPWSTVDEMRADLNSFEGQDRYLMAGLAQNAARRGLLPGPDQVYDFKVPPVLGGPLDVDNLDVTDVVVSLNIAGQIHGQVRDVPPGTPIAGITIDTTAFGRYSGSSRA